MRARAGDPLAPTTAVLILDTFTVQKVPPEICLLPLLKSNDLNVIDEEASAADARTSPVYYL